MTKTYSSMISLEKAGLIFQCYSIPPEKLTTVLFVFIKNTSTSCAKENRLVESFWNSPTMPPSKTSLRIWISLNLKAGNKKPICSSKAMEAKPIIRQITTLNSLFTIKQINLLKEFKTLSTQVMDIKTPTNQPCSHRAKTSKTLGIRCHKAKTSKTLGIRCHKAKTSKTLGIRCHKVKTTHLSLDGIPISHNGTKTAAGDLNHKFYND